ncbi:unnamed protein product [Clavelina lepadiformis]|uniref:LRRNT domain-containing protein n=1 Tax=Clavelina lepadiformis TaxID=159417 RepID=A0ABP0F791_CLALP
MPVSFFMVLFLSIWILSEGENLEDLSYAVESENGENDMSEWQGVNPFYDCPESCYCRSLEHVDCSEADLDEVPLNISRSTIYLMLNKNRLHGLSSDTFYNCPLIRTLNLQDNMLSDDGISPATFAPLHDLRHLILSDNRFLFVPEGLPNTLITLHLSGNAIKQIDPITLAWKGQLRHLYLHDNRLTRQGMKPKIFDGLTHLEEVTLANNKFSSFPPIPASAEVVYLQNNSIVAIPEGSFRRRRNIRVLFLQKNNISDEGLRKKSFVGLQRIEYLDLSDNNLTTVPDNLPKKLKRLHLERNKISNLSAAAMKRLSKVEYLILHHNSIASSHIENNAFGYLKHLHTLHIFDNKLQEIPSNLPFSLQSLILLQNQIRSIAASSFSKTKNLKQLDLRYNELTNRRIARGALRQLSSLTMIDFTGNKLRAVPVLPRNVTILLLAANFIKRIPPNSLARMPRLRHLALGNNDLNNDGIPLYAFRNSGDMQVLDLSGNYLTSVPKYLPVNLEHLYLQENMIESIPRNTFFSCLKLKAIHLQDNQLLPETVSKAAFTPLRFLQRIDVTWRRRRPDEVFYDMDSSSRRRRSLSSTRRILCGNGWYNDECARVTSEPCLSGKIMVHPR